MCRRLRYDRAMKSRLAEQSELDVIRLAQQLTPTQRLEAFLAQCQLMEALRRAGEAARARPPERADADEKPR